MSSKNAGRRGFLMGLIRSAFSLKGLVIMVLGAIVVAVLGGPAKDLVEKAAEKIKSLKK